MRRRTIPDSRCRATARNLTFPRRARQASAARNLLRLPSRMEPVNRPRSGPGIGADSSDEDEALFESTDADAQVQAISSCNDEGAICPREHDCVGMLLGQEAGGTKWRWTVLIGSKLFRFDHGNVEPRGIINLNGITVAEEDALTLLLVTAKRCYTLRASDAREKRQWLSALRAKDRLRVGWLHKRGEINTAYKRRWFMLDAAGRRLLYFAVPPKALNVAAVVDLKELDAPPTIGGSVPGAAGGFGFTLRLAAPAAPLLFAAADHRSRVRWVRALGALVAQAMPEELGAHMLHRASRAASAAPLPATRLQRGLTLGSFRSSISSAAVSSRATKAPGGLSPEEHLRPHDEPRQPPDEPWLPLHAA